jgi:hypothetical protein
MEGAGSVHKRKIQVAEEGPGLYTCTVGSTVTEIDANYEYVIKPTDLQLVDNRWVVSQFEGSFRSQTQRNGRLFRWIL